MSKGGVIIVGAGPAGLSAAYTLAGAGWPVTILEKDVMVGGMARTVSYRGFRFDIGGHRFFSDIPSIRELWADLLEDDLITVKRISRIYYRNRFIKYPIDLADVMMRLGMIESMMIGLSYMHAGLFPAGREDTFEQWVSNRFGKRLYQIFFKEYTEKVWGVACDRIGSEWASQRIKGLSFISVILKALGAGQRSRSLIDAFLYPIHGPGMMWDAMAGAVTDNGGQILLDTGVHSIRHDEKRLNTVVFDRCNLPDASDLPGGLNRPEQPCMKTVEMPVTSLISSIPVNQLVEMLQPLPPKPVLEAARSLSYRSLVVAGLILDQPSPFPDQWIYIQEPGYRVGRIQNFKNWSSGMTPDPEKTNIGMEYFCSRGDDFWQLSDQAIIAMAEKELVNLGLAGTDAVIDGFVVRQPDAYPVYLHGYQEKIRKIRQYLKRFDNLQTIGRNGRYRYNNMDHAMQSGILAAKNIMGETHDLWQIEETVPDVSYNRQVTDPETRQAIVKTFARMDKTAFGFAVGSVSGLFFFLATIWLVIKGGATIGPRLALLGQYFIGYTVTVKGAFVAFFYGMLWGFFFGCLFAWLRNFFLSYYMYRLKKKVELWTLQDFFDQI